MECIYVAGWLMLAGTDWNGDRYILNIEKFVYAQQVMSVSDVNNDSRPRTLLHTENGVIVEDLEILDVAVGLARCEELFYDYGYESVE
jgi:hypothetical protein